MTFLKNLLSNILIFLLRGIRPLLGTTHCRYPISCTNYAILQLQKQNLIIAFIRISKRVLFCNPFYKPSLKKEDYEKNQTVAPHHFLDHRGSKQTPRN